MHEVLKALFEESIYFQDAQGEPIEGSVFIGEVEFPPVDVLRTDPVAYQDAFVAWLTETWLSEQQAAREEILARHNNASRYVDLRLAVRRDKVVPFVGSGMSVPSEFPTWSDFLRRIRAMSRMLVEELEMLLAAGRFEEAADRLALSMHRNRFDEQIEHRLRVEEPARITGAIRFLGAIFSGDVVTTNLDDLQETYRRGAGSEFTDTLVGHQIGGYRERRGGGERLLLKLHGDCHGRSGRVLLTAEYDVAYAVGSPVREELSWLYRSFHLLFLGCSLSEDRTMQLLAEVATQDANMLKHYAFLHDPGDHDQLLEREEFLAARGVYPIWYEGEHDEAITALLVGLVDDTVWY